MSLDPLEMTSANNPANEEKTKQGYRQLNFTSRKTPQTTTHLKADCQVPTWSTTTRDAHFAEARCATLALHRTLYDNESREEKHRKWTPLIALSVPPTLTGETEMHACDRRTREDKNRAHNIWIHQDMLEIDTIHPEKSL